LGFAQVKQRRCRYDVLRLCHNVKLSVPLTPAGTSLAEGTLHARSALIVPQGTLSSKKPHLSQTNVGSFLVQGTGLEPA